MKLKLKHLYWIVFIFAFLLTAKKYYEPYWFFQLYFGWLDRRHYTHGVTRNCFNKTTAARIECYCDIYSHRTLTFDPNKKTMLTRLKFVLPVKSWNRCAYHEMISNELITQILFLACVTNWNMSLIRQCVDIGLVMERSWKGCTPV